MSYDLSAPWVDAGTAVGTLLVPVALLLLTKEFKTMASPLI